MMDTTGSDFRIVRSGEAFHKGNLPRLQLFAGLATAAAAGTVILAFPPGQAVWVLAGAALYLLSFFRPKVGLALVAVAIALSPEIDVAGIAIRLEDVLLTAVIAGSALRHLAFRDRLHPIALAGPLAAYVAVAVVATAWGAVLGTVSLTARDQLSGASFHVLKRIEFALLFGVVAYNLSTASDVRRFTSLIMVALAALNIYGVLTYLQTGVIAQAPAGASGHEVGLASLVLVALALGILSGPARRWERILAIAAICLGLLVLPLSQGRNFALTTAVLVAVFAVTRRQLAMILVPAIALTVAIGLYPAHILMRLVTLKWLFSTEAPAFGSVAPASILYRLQAPIHFGLDALAGSPLLGFGLASLPLGFLDNEYATQFYYTGAVGTFIFAWLAVAIVRLLKRLLKEHRARPSARSFLVGYAFVLAGYALFSMASPSVSAARSGALFFFLTGILASLARARGEEESHTTAHIS